MNAGLGRVRHFSALCQWLSRHSKQPLQRNLLRFPAVARISGSWTLIADICSIFFSTILIGVHWHPRLSLVSSPTTTSRRMSTILSAPLSTSVGVRLSSWLRLHNLFSRCMWFVRVTGLRRIDLLIVIFFPSINLSWCGTEAPLSVFSGPWVCSQSTANFIHLNRSSADWREFDLLYFLLSVDLGICMFIALLFSLAQVIWFLNGLRIGRCRDCLSASGWHLISSSGKQSFKQFI